MSMNDYVESAVKDGVSRFERIIKDAFRQHFGFDISDADKEELCQVITKGSDIMSLQYHHETFLYFTDWKYEYRRSDGKIEVLMKTKYKFV